MALLSDVLVVNAGSTSLKLTVVGRDGSSRVVASLEAAPPVAAVGHRLVHGGEHLIEPTLIDDAVVDRLRAVIELAPLHNGPAVDAIEAARALLPNVAHVAVFDTTFHRALPARARTYLLPARYRERGIHKFGFHGLSIEWASECVPVPRLVVCHLGGGSSVTAVQDGSSVDTSMGFTPLEGVPMATRPGSLDPGVLLHLLNHGVTVAELDHALEHESGLLGLAGTADMAELERSGAPEARLAFEIYCYRVAQMVSAMVTALGGLDALVFTAGIGEHSARVRSAVCAHLGFLGVRLDERANTAGSGDRELAAPDSSARVRVVAAREDVVVARAVRNLVGASRSD